MSQPTVISLYSGAGGLDLGFAEVGFELLWANDFDPLAVQTYRENIGDHATAGDVLEVLMPEVRPDVVVGGPPCQGFSVIGRMREDDPRSKHIFHFFDVVERLAPRCFVMENVKALGVSPRWRPLREQLLERAQDLGYTTRLVVLNAADYGVPQARERMFLLGSRLGEAPSAPEPTTAHRWPTVREALALLPPYGQPGNDSVTRARVVPSREPVMRPSAYAGSLLFNGSGRPLDLDRPAKTLPASMGGNATPIIDQLELAEGAEPWVVAYHRELQRGGAPARSAPPRLRRITVEEAAVLQGFPVSFRFRGPRVAQYRQIGNAVPPPLARAVAASVHEHLAAERPLLAA
ncbi:MAG TPA: DNA cytosine methyltransferase [Baekduia sp.]|nr:DNA cytosine methyltransferase [Baekduia sp.]